VTTANGAPVVVTGAEGFVGSWLVPELAAAYVPVIAVHKPGTPLPSAEAASAHAEPVEADLRRRGALLEVLRDTQPRAVVHLAAVAVPREAARDPDEALAVNYTAVDHLVAAILEASPHTRLLYVSSGEVYGRQSRDDPPAAETAELRPPNPYAATKAAAEQRVALAVERERLDAVRVRPFNHSGPGRPPVYAESDFARQVALLERGGGEPVVRVGNLEAIRDFSDVRDVVRAYRLLLERGERGGVYNVCSGQPRSIRSVLDYLVSRARRELRVEVDAARFEALPEGAVGLVGDPTRIRALGWEPAHPFESTLDDLLDDWRSRA